MKMSEDQDALTGLRNHWSFREDLVQVVARAHRAKRPLALVLLDVDDFKRVNDRHGHVAGDTVLRNLADRIRRVFRSVDLTARVGGDEFAVLLPEAGLHTATRLAARLNRRIADEPIDVAGVTFSSGIVELEAGEDAASFFERAADALYRSKQQPPPDDVA
jgi:diguanylate cyclase (GGDEF)-like protein